MDGQEIFWKATQSKLCTAYKHFTTITRFVSKTNVLPPRQSIRQFLLLLHVFFFSSAIWMFAALFQLPVYRHGPFILVSVQISRIAMTTNKWPPEDCDLADALAWASQVCESQEPPLLLLVLRHANQHDPPSFTYCTLDYSYACSCRQQSDRWYIIRQGKPGRTTIQTPCWATNCMVLSLGSYPGSMWKDLLRHHRS